MAIGLISFAICLDGNGKYADDYASRTGEPEPGFLGAYHDGWRQAAVAIRTIVNARAEKGPVVIGSLDMQLNVMLTEHSNTFLYLDAPYRTPATDEEQLRRMFGMFILLGADDKFVLNILNSPVTPLHFTSNGAYQVNRIHTYFRPSMYPPEMYDRAFLRRDNWATLTPPVVIQKQFESYQEFYKQVQANPAVLNMYHLPDILILNLGHGLDTREIKGYKLVGENGVFRVFERLSSAS